MSRETAMALATPQVAQPAAPAPEVSAPIENATTEIKSLDSDRFAKLAAKEAALVKAREETKLERQRINEEKEKLRYLKDAVDKFTTLQKTDPVAALKEIGFKEEDIFNFMAAKEEPTPEQKAAKLAEETVQSEIKKFRDEQLKKEQEELAKRDAQAISAFKAEIPKLIAKEVDKYEYCSHYGPIAEELIFDTVLLYMKDDPKLLPHDALREATEAVEQMYEHEDQELSKLKKRQPKVEAAPVIEEKPKQLQRTRTPEVKTEKPKTNTLTNKLTPTVASTIPKSETRSEKKERLANMLRNSVLVK